MRRTQYAICAVLMFLCTITIGVGEDAGPGTRSPGKHGFQLTATQEKQLKEVVSGATEDVDRNTLVPALVNLLQTNAARRKTTKVMSSAIQALGTLKAQDASPLLVSMIDIVDVTKPSTQPNLMDTYPSVPALIRIGEASVDPLLNELREVTSDDRESRMKRKLLTFALCQIQGEETSRVLLQQRTADESAESRRQSYAKALALIDEVRTWGRVQREATNETDRSTAP